MMVEYSTDKKIRPEELLALAETQGWGNSRPVERNAMAISGSIFIASARRNGQLIGILRLIGDGAYCLHIADFIVEPQYQKIGIGTKLLEMCLEYAKKVSIGIGNNIGEFTLFANISADKFYENFEFLSAPNGMVLASSEKRKRIETEFNRQWIKERKKHNKWMENG